MLSLRGCRIPPYEFVPLCQRSFLLRLTHEYPALGKFVSKTQFRVTVHVSGDRTGTQLGDAVRGKR